MYTEATTSKSANGLEYVILVTRVPGNMTSKSAEITSIEAGTTRDRHESTQGTYEGRPKQKGWV